MTAMHHSYKSSAAAALAFSLAVGAAADGGNLFLRTRGMVQEPSDADLAQCVASQDTIDFVNQYAALGLQRNQAGGYFIPTVPDNQARPFYLNDPLPSPPFPAGTREGFEWFANVIPAEHDPANGDDVDGLPPPFPFENQAFPFYNFRTDAASWGYNKWPAFPVWPYAFLAVDPGSSGSSDDRGSLFIKNLRDRGEDNLLKKQYMSALTCDKLERYEAKIDRAVDAFFEDIAREAKPVLSSWKERSFELYMDLHLGGIDHPDFVYQYFEEFAELLAPANEQYAFQFVEKIRLGSCLHPYMDAYVKERFEYITGNEDTSTFLYWWDQADMPKESIIFEAIHNVLAWGNLINVLFLTIRAKLVGYVATKSVTLQEIEQIDFFQKMDEAVTKNERLDVVREAFRMLTPSNLILSQVDTQGAGQNDGKYFGDVDLDRTNSIHVPSVIQALNDGFNTTSTTTEAWKYDTGRYADFQPSGCPHQAGFKKSGVDNETVLPASHEAFFPVFPSGSPDAEVVHGPKYCPFGLGYRRCPSEILNVFVVEKLLLKLSALDFKFDPPIPPADVPVLFRNILPNEPLYAESVPMGLARTLDRLFVDSDDYYYSSKSSKKSSGSKSSGSKSSKSSSSGSSGD